MRLVLIGALFGLTLFSCSSVSSQEFCGNYLKSRQCMLHLKSDAESELAWNQIASSCLSTSAQCDEDSLSNLNNTYLCLWNLCQSSNREASFDAQAAAQCGDPAGSSCYEKILSGENP